MCDQQLDVATVEAEAEPKSLTNIYYDCLERIFDFLDIESLMNVAGTCKRLQIAAAAKFADDYSHVSVQLIKSRFDNTIWKKTYSPSMKTAIHIFGLKFCLTFLRCFGARILNLYISSMWDMQNDPIINVHIIRYINQYCANSLVSICIEDGRSLSSEIFTRPFKTVKQFLVRCNNLGDQLPKYVEYFPYLNDLAFFGRPIDDNAIAVSFPYLEYLRIELDENGSRSFTSESAIKFLRANQQVQSLVICMTANFDKILDVISASKSILKLRIFGGFTDVSAIQLNRLANEHPLLEDLRFDYVVFEVDDAMALIRQVPSSLKRFEFNIKDQTDCDRFLIQLDSKWKHEIKPYQFDISVRICLARV